MTGITNTVAYLIYAAVNKLNMREIAGYNMSEYLYVDPGAQVCDGLYIGSLATATSKACLSRNNITAIINLSGTKYTTSNHVTNIFMNDAPVTIENLDEYLRSFELGVFEIKKLRERGERVLVHCAAGINRSATLIMFYLMNSGWSYKNALESLERANKIRGVPLLTNESFKYLLCVTDSLKRRNL